MPNRNMTVGIFVVVGVALFTLGIFLIGDQHKSFTRHIEFYTAFANLDGVMKGTKVRVAGLDAGEVVDIAVPDHPSSQFRVKLRIDHRFHGLVRTDSLVTIGTAGVVGDQFLLVHQGSTQAAEAGSLTTLPSREPLDLSDLMERSAGLLKDANGTMTEVTGRLNGALDAITSTANNANEVVIGLKQGRGTAGMLLHDEATATEVRQTVGNTREATTALSHASSQADALISDLQSRQLGQKADDTILSTKSAAQNIKATSQQVRQSLAQALGPNEEGADASTNIQQSLSNLNQASGNMADDTEALKHTFFLRGFFKHRGYYNLAHLVPEQYRRNKVFASSTNHREWLTGKELFQPGENGLETLSSAGKRQIDAVVDPWADLIVEAPIVVEGYSAIPDENKRLAVSRHRAVLVRQYLQTHFHLNIQNIGMVALGDLPPPNVGKATWDGVCVVILNQSR